jgi:predicted transcriptional regulator of viral defense system
VIEKQGTKGVKGMKATEAFLFSHPVFSWSEWKKEVGDSRSEKTLRNLLSYYLKRGRLKRVDGVYCVVPPLTEPSTFIPDRFLVASKLSPDSVLSYHTAFEILGFANQVFTTTYYSSLRYKRPFSHQGIRYVCVRLPHSLKSNPFFGVVRVERMGMFVRVTSAERTLAECLDRPEYCGGFEEAIRCISSLPFVDEELLKAYLNLRGKVVLFGKVGWVLEQLRERLFITEGFLQWLKGMSPKHPVSVCRGFEGEKVFVKRWNLVVPLPWLAVLEGIKEEAIGAFSKKPKGMTRRMKESVGTKGSGGVGSVS